MGMQEHAGHPRPSAAVLGYEPARVIGRTYPYPPPHCYDCGTLIPAASNWQQVDKRYYCEHCIRGRKP